jgi:hypothetical protein
MSPNRTQPCGEGSRQAWVGEVAVPDGQHAAHPVGIGQVPGHGRPVDVPDDQPPAGAEVTVQLGKGGSRSETYSSTCTDSALSKLTSPAAMG